MNETSPGVVVTGLVKRFDDVAALDGVDLRAERGTVLGLLGPNGAGKTTAVRVLSTLLEPDEGSVQVGGHDVVHDPAAVRQRLGLTGQFAAVDDELTGTENLVLFGRLRGLSKADARQRAEELLESFDLVDAATQRVGTYSGGMRRRLDLAVSLVTEPEVLVLDEPTTGLDPRSRLALWDQVRALRDRGITILLTTQYLEEADVLADRIVVIDQGRVVAEGTPGELKQRIGGVAVHVAVTDPDRLGEVEAILAAEGLQVTVHPESSAASAAAASPSRSGWDLLAAVGESLAAAGIEIEDLGLRRPSLDEVFLALTGSGGGVVTAAMRDGALLAGRNLQRGATGRPIVSVAVMPLIFLFGFSAVLGRSVEALGIDYAQYLPPVIVLQAMFFTGIASAFFLADDRASGMIERCRSLPIHPWSVLLGRLGADGVRALVSMTVVLVASTLLGFRFSAGVVAAAGFVAVTLLFAVTVAGGCSVVGLTARSSEAAVSTLSLPYLPLLMLSTGFVPLEGFPGWIQPVVQWQPVSLTVDALRALSTGGPTAEPVLRAVAALTVLLVVFGVLSARAFRRAS